MLSVKIDASMEIGVNFLQKIMFRRMKSWAIWGAIAIAAIASWSLATPALAVSSESAMAQFQEAYENRYTWDSNFPGFSAEVSINDEGTLDHGIVRVSPAMEVSVNNVKDPQMSKLIRKMVESEVIHRQPVAFDKRHNVDDLRSRGYTNQGARVLSESNEEGISSYEIKDGKIQRIKRYAEGKIVSIDTVGFIDTTQGYLPTHYTVTIYDRGSGEVREKEDVRDFYEKIGSYYLLTNRNIRRVESESEDPEDKMVPDTIVRFNNVQPL
jgi:hypothetical protein